MTNLTSSSTAQNSSMFSRDFYPTPRHVLEMMGIDCYGKVVLEPSAGNGNIITYLKDNGATRVLACELNEDLAKIVQTKGEFITHDFLNLKAKEISHIDMIVMNPPFSCGVKHLLHAYAIAPEGCEIISLVNHSNYANDQWSSERRTLKTTIDNYGSYENLGDVFSQNQTERTTDVSIGLVKLYKPKTFSDTEFDGFFEDEYEERQAEEGSEGAIVSFNAIQEIVGRYVASVKCYGQFTKVKASLVLKWERSRSAMEILSTLKIPTKESFKRKHGLTYLKK